MATGATNSLNRASQVVAEFTDAQKCGTPIGVVQEKGSHQWARLCYRTLSISGTLRGANSATFGLVTAVQRIPIAVVAVVVGVITAIAWVALDSTQALVISIAGGGLIAVRAILGEASTEPSDPSDN